MACDEDIFITGKLLPTHPVAVLQIVCSFLCVFPISARELLEFFIDYELVKNKSLCYSQDNDFWPSWSGQKIMQILFPCWSQAAVFVFQR